VEGVWRYGHLVFSTVTNNQQKRHLETQIREVDSVF